MNKIVQIIPVNCMWLFYAKEWTSNPSLDTQNYREMSAERLLDQPIDFFFEWPSRSPGVALVEAGAQQAIVPLDFDPDSGEYVPLLKDDYPLFVGPYVGDLEDREGMESFKMRIINKIKGIANE
jgi:hypothetical protein